MPVPTIFLIDNHNRISEMKNQPYASEERLQNFLAEFPGVLAGELGGSAPLKWLLIKREAAIPGEDGGAERWSVDHLFVDNNGIPTLVEVKRSTDTRIRREVVGQMLDYAANAAQYWPVETIRQWFEQTCGEGIDPNVRLAEALGLDDATEEAAARFWETVETNLRAGRLRLIFAADEIPPELRRIIEFLDEHMNPTEVMGIEIRQYVGANGRTLVPGIIRSSRRSTPAASRVAAVSWNRESFLGALVQKKGAERAEVVKSIMEWAGANGIALSWGRGRFDGSCSLGIHSGGVDYCPVAMWTSGGMQLQNPTLRQRGAPPELIGKFVAELNTIPGIAIPPDSMNKYPSFDMALLTKPEAMRKFSSALASFLDQIRAAT
jgi:hypothetical protein